MASGTDSKPLWMLPIECLALVTQAIAGSDILRLWCSGDSHLRLALVNGGATSVYLADSSLFFHSRFPRALRQFKYLRELELHVYEDKTLGESDELAAELLQLSPKLERLVLNFRRSAECLLRPFVAATMLSMFEDFDCNTSTLSPMEKATGSRLWDIKTIFPALKALHVRDSTNYFLPSDYEYATRSLEEFTISGSSPFTPEAMNFLSRDLRRLTLKDIKLDPHCVSVMPPNLLVLNMSEEYQLTPVVAQFPRTLTSVTMRTTTDNLAVLPPPMQTIHIANSGISTEQLLLLPKSLTNLQLTGVRLAANVHTLSALPRTLLSWEIHNCMSIALEKSQLPQPQDWPPNLTHFEIRDRTGKFWTPLSFVRSLPSTIRHLRLLEWSEAEHLRILIPKHLQQYDLKVSTYEALQRIESRYWTNMTTLELAIVSPNYYMDPLSCLPASTTSIKLGGNITLDTIWGHLPRGLLSFESISSTMSTQEPAHPRNFKWSKGLSAAPPGLTSLKINRKDIELSSTWFHSLPSRLETLYLILAGSVGVDMVSAFPTSLTSLKLEFDNEPEEIVAALPRRLRHFSIGQVSLWNGSVVKSLPKGLQSISTREFPGLRDEHVIFMPRDLRVIRIRSSSVTAYAALALPPKLTYCSITAAVELAKLYRKR